MKIDRRPTFPEPEYRLRRSKLQGRLAARGVQGAVLLCHKDISWVTGFLPTILAPNMAFLGAYLPAEGEIRIVAMPAIANLMRETGWGEVTTAASPDEAIRTLAEMASGTAPVGVEHSMGLHRSATAAEIDALETAIGRRRLVDVSDAVWAGRMVKTAWEVDRYRRLGGMTADGFRAGLAAVAEGVPEAEVARAMRERFFVLGADSGPTTGQVMVRSGRERYPVYCGAPTDRHPRRGEQIMLAGGPTYCGYHIDIHRFANIGPVEELQRTLYARSRAGLEAAIAAVRPGATTGQVFDAAIHAFRALGYDEPVQWQVMGHGIGLENYEYPMIAEGGDVELVENMVLAIEVPAYDVPDFRVFGAFLEDCVVVTAYGCDVLTRKVPLDLHVVP